MSKTTNLRYVIFLACTAALGGLLFGFDVAIITGAGPFLTRHFALSDISLGWAFSSLLFGCVLGSFAAGRLTDRLGRKRMLVWVAVLFALTSVATAAAPSFALFICARFLGGIAVGGVSLLSPMYVSEVSPPSIRGRMGTFYQLSIVTGILISYCCNYLLRNTGEANWRWMFLTGAVPSLLFLVLISLAPETPRFLVRVGKTREAFDLLERIENDETARKEIAAITEALKETRPTWQNFKRPGVRRALIASACLAILIHVSGINTIIDYAPAIFISAGWKVDAALVSTFLVGVVNGAVDHGRFLGDRSLRAQAAVYHRFAGHDARACRTAGGSAGRALSRHTGSASHPDVSCVFLVVRGARSSGRWCPRFSRATCAARP